MADLIKVSPTNLESSSCAVCFKSCTKYCGNCHKIFYCCFEHQKLDRKIHKSQCFPIKIVKDVNKGRCVIATRDIKPGELLLKDEELIAAPNGNVLCTLPEFRPMCLSCFRILSIPIENNHVCSICGFPMCDTECEMDPSHTNFECPIFAENKIEPFTRPLDYDFIKVLRALLLMERNPTKWEQLMDLESHETIRAKLPNCVKKTFDTVMFIKTRCKLIQFDYKVINYLVGVFRINAFGNHNWPLPLNRNGVRPNGGFREGTFLFYWSSMFAHNCVPNTRSYLLQERSPNSYRETHFQKYLLATIEIPAGTEICISYIETRQGINERLKILRRSYHFDCNCLRCSDPTEFGLYFSAIKCQKCPIGYILPVNSLSIKSIWKCTNTANCNVEASYEELLNTIEEIQAQIIITRKDLEESNGGLGAENLPLIALGLKKLLEELQDVKLHRNHWVLIDLEYDIIKYTRGVFMEIYGKEEEEEEENSSTADNSTNYPDNSTKTWKKYLIKTVEFIDKITRHCLEIGGILRPGISIFRGCLMYSLAQCAYIKYELEVQKREQEEVNVESNKKLIEMRTQLLAYLNEANDILSIEPEGSDEFEIGKQIYNVILKSIKKQDVYFLAE